ncbi:MAG: UDP-N-acetylmuramoyl-tripeptide--D-alanyl-D-alanine ligase [Pseudomonadota bacterium]
MTALWEADEAASATGGQARGDWRATGVSIDTRSLAPGDLFIALKDQRDGHAFVADALAKGAAAAMVSRIPGGLAPDAPLLVVEDVLDALRALGKAARKRTSARVVGITGSVGKTSTKEMLRAALGVQAQVHGAEASFNNHWGVPLTLARMPHDTDIALIEIGMNAPGEIAPLAKLAKLDIALITTVAPAHLAAFDDLSGIAVEKGSIFEGLRKGGTAIYNGDVETAKILKAAAKASKAGRLVKFGRAKGADARLLSVTPSETVTVAEGRLAGRDVLFKLATPGAHFAENALAALAVTAALEADLALAIHGLGHWVPPPGRGAAERLELDPVEDWWAKLIDDAYNANPTSMGAAFEALALTQPLDHVGRVAKGRRIAILGDMLELGPAAEDLHADLANHPAMEAIDRVDCAGPLMGALWEALPREKRGQWVEEAEELAAQAHQLVDAGDAVLVKGSKGSRISLVVSAMRKLKAGRVREG